MLLFFKALGMGAWSLAKRLKLPWIICALALAFAAVQSVKLGIERRHSAKVEHRVNELKAELDRITDERNRQKETTVRNMDTFREIIREVPTVIERAPNPADCGTPALAEGREKL